MTKRDFCLTGVTISLAPGSAWARFVDQMHIWWPREYTWSQNDLGWIGIRDGHCLEINRNDDEKHWGMVISRTEPESLTFSWNIGPGSTQIPVTDRAGNVSVSFSKLGNSSTRVSLMHSGFERYGDGWQQYREDMASDMGWNYILARYADLTVT